MYACVAVGVGVAAAACIVIAGVELSGPGVGVPVGVAADGFWGGGRRVHPQQRVRARRSNIVRKRGETRMDGAAPFKRIKPYELMFFARDTGHARYIDDSASAAPIPAPMAMPIGRLSRERPVLIPMTRPLNQP
jgi:hypothetical protein